MSRNKCKELHGPLSVEDACSYRSRKQGDKVLGEYSCSHVAEGGVHFELYILYLSYFDLTFYLPLVKDILQICWLQRNSMTVNRPGAPKIR